MKKKLSPIWFLKEPLDPEHKEYVLLDYLKSVSKDLNEENCYSVIREISRIVKTLNEYKESGKIDSIKKFLKKEDLDFTEKLLKKELTKEESSSIEEIIEKSLETLYGYSEICLEILKGEESKIKIFRIQSKFEQGEENKSGIVIIRNMVTDKLINYYFKSQVTMKTEDGDKEIYILKKIHIKNPFFSLNYEYIYHEILNDFNLDNGILPSLYVIEIYENFEEDSEIYKIAKEKFIGVISKDEQ
jgi:hypothetical protein